MPPGFAFAAGLARFAGGGAFTLVAFVVGLVTLVALADFDVFAALGRPALARFDATAALTDFFAPFADALLTLFRAATFRAGPFFEAVFLVAALPAGAFLAGAFPAEAFLVAAFPAKAFLAGAFFAAVT